MKASVSGEVYQIVKFEKREYTPLRLLCEKYLEGPLRATLVKVKATGRHAIIVEHDVV